MSPIPTRQLGKNGPMVPRIGYGTMGLSLGYGKPVPDEQSLEVLDHAHKIGAAFWDTSDFYGDSEEVLGKWFTRSGKRSDIFLATKFGAVRLGGGNFGFRGDAVYVSEACEQSLKRLGVEHIDLWYPHRLDGSTPVELIVAEMVKMKEYALNHPVPIMARSHLRANPSYFAKRQGKIRHLGLCEVSAATLRRAHAVHPIAAVQVEYSPFSTEIEDGLLQACRELGVAVVAYSPLSRGLLSGQIKSRDGFGEDDIRRFYPRFNEENFPKNMALVAELGRIAEVKGCTVGQLTLAWLLGQGDDIFPIPGTKNIKYLEENSSAADVELTPDEVARIRSLLNNASFGARYAPEHSFALFSDTPLLEDHAAGKGSEVKAGISGRVV
ncbi:Uu.00g038640.m01.CDS01 [Anthostomella pinea]|uniref:Uu.00g038640.m01.CDS01 n=1 Tax=Anthostomella pinea TaxID=933095 RepID=A0AAI8VAW3_9PEZI|nr:Uu.00g038640.m01.CDS01 [Anthostomella pinea]